MIARKSDAISTRDHIVNIGDTRDRSVIAENVDVAGIVRNGGMDQNRDPIDRSSDGRSATGTGAGLGLLEVNAKLVHATPKTAILQAQLQAQEKSQAKAKKHVSGLARVKLAPRGVDAAKLEKDDLQTFKRLLRWQRLRMAQHILHGQRVEKCHRVRFKPSVGVWYSPTVKRAHYKNLVICGSVWACAVDAPKISERRKTEIETAPRLNDFSKFMVTFTLQHNNHDHLKALVNDLNAGIRDMKHQRGYKHLIERFEIVGFIRGFEVTVSNVNGWHPHVHEMGFSKLPQEQLDREELQSSFASLFVSSMQKQKRYVDAEIGVNIQVDNVVASYGAKMGEGEKKTTWTLAAEITKGSAKSGRDEEHYHPFELLDMVAAGNMDAARLFIEYAVTMFGKAQLRYTPGLRKLLCLDEEQTDQEIAEATSQDSYLLACITAEGWKKVLSMGSEKRGTILEVASSGNFGLFASYCRKLGIELEKESE